MTVILMLLMLVFGGHGVTEASLWPPGEVITETCQGGSPCDTPPPTELPGPPTRTYRGGSCY